MCDNAELSIAMWWILFLFYWVSVLSFPNFIFSFLFSLFLETSQFSLFKSPHICAVCDWFPFVVPLHFCFFSIVDLKLFHSRRHSVNTTECIALCIATIENDSFFLSFYVQFCFVLFGNKKGFIFQFVRLKLSLGTNFLWK